MRLNGKKIGFAITGSFCTLDKAINELQKFVAEGADVFPIISYSVNEFDTRFGKASEWKSKIEVITGKKPIASIVDAEPIGPKSYLDVVIVLPCTGNTLAKIAGGITDTPVTMAVKAHLRNNKPVVISLSTNDALSANAKNLGLLLNARNIFFVPFSQDDPYKKYTSIIAKTDLAVDTVIEAMNGRQIQPLIIV